jgi:hypothetical protein
MNTCSSCQWWGFDPEVEEDEANRSMDIPGGPSHKCCGHPKVGYGSYTDPERQDLDALNCYDAVGTGPLFGCIHHELKVAG